MPPPIEDEIDEQEIRAAFGRIDHHSPRDGDGDGKNNNDEKSVTTKTSLHLWIIDDQSTTTVGMVWYGNFIPWSWS